MERFIGVDTLDKHRSGRPRTSRTEENIDAVAQSVRINPTLSTRKRSCALNVPRTSLQRILMKDLHLHPYKSSAHTSNTAVPVVRQLFPNKVISRRGDIPWPQRSPDLTPMDFFLRGYLKSKVFETNPRSIKNIKISDEK